MFFTRDERYKSSFKVSSYKSLSKTNIIDSGP